MKIPVLLLIGSLLLPMIAGLEISSVEFGPLSGNMVDASQPVHVKGGETVRVVVRVFNEKLEDVEDLHLEAEIDDLDIEVESESFDVDAQERGRLEVELTLPYRLEEDEYQLHVSVVDEEQLYYSTDILLKVKKKAHNLEVIDYELFPQEVICGKQVRLSVDVLNVGEENEEEVRVHFLSENFDWSYLSPPVDVKNQGEAKSVSAIVSIPSNVETGDYSVLVTPRYRYGYFDREPYIVKIPVRCKSEKAVVKVPAKEKNVAKDTLPLDVVKKVTSITPVAVKGKPVPTVPLTGAVVKHVHPLQKDFEEIGAFLSYYRVEMSALTAVLGLLTLALVLLVAFKDDGNKNTW